MHFPGNDNAFSALPHYLRLRQLPGFILSIGVALLATEAHADNASQCSYFSYYVLSLEWPQTFCRELQSKNDCRIPKTVAGWVIHGLWPHDNTRGKNPSRCAGPQYAESNVADLVSERQSIWPDLRSRRNETTSSDAATGSGDPFWRHEWKTHGTCALACDPGISSQHGYFQLALDLASKVDIDQVLNAASIEPSDKYPISGQSIVNAVKAANGATPVIKCYPDKDNGTSYLSEIRICLELGSHDLIDCQPDIISEHQTCPADIIYAETSGH